MEDAPPDAQRISGRPGLRAGHECDREHDRADALGDQREDGDPLQQAAHGAELQPAERLLDEDAIAQRRAPAEEKLEQQRGAGHDPEAAGLDEQQDDDLAERAPVRRGVDHHEARNTRRTRCREERVDETRRLAGGGCHRQHQQCGAGGDEDDEDEEQRGRRRRRSADPVWSPDAELLGPGPLDADAPVARSLALVRHRLWRPCIEGG